MSDLFIRYIIDLYQEVPAAVYAGLVLVFCLGAVVLFAIKGFSKGLKLSAGLVTIEYVVLIYCSTVAIREYSENANHDFSRNRPLLRKVG